VVAKQERTVEDWLRGFLCDAIDDADVIVDVVAVIFDVSSVA
jgi:hypothetical protein